MNSTQDLDIDALLLSTLSPTPLDTPFNDPAFRRIYEYLRDPSKNTFEATNNVDSSTFSDTNASDDVSDSFKDHIQQSETVEPIYMSPVGSNIPQVDTHELLKQQTTVQHDNSQSKKIEIIANPRTKFRPRTEKESKDSSHYIRCEEYMPFKYPTVGISQEWNQQKNIIEVTLVDINKNPHPYALDNKECKTSTLVFKQNQQNSLYFHVTEEDYKKHQKSFMIEYIKPKLDGNITKELIKTRQLDQSMLRFTRFYQISDGTYHQDLSSIEYSSIMIEDYGDFNIEDVFPSYGPMGGNQKVCVELKGHLPKGLNTDLIIHIIDGETSWSHQVKNIKKNRNNLTFLMPPYPYEFMGSVKVNISIQYKEEIIHQSSYIYSRKIDDELARDNFSKSKTTMVSTNVSNNLTGALPIHATTTMGDEIRCVKRARQ